MRAKEEINQQQYNELKQELDKEKDYFSKQIESTKGKLNSHKKALKTRPKHFSEDLKIFKTQIKDILYEVEVNKDNVRINIENLLIYEIPQRHPSSIGWHKRSNKPFETPFKTGIKLISVLTDEDMPAYIDEQTSPDKYYAAINEHLEETKGQGSRSPKKETYEHNDEAEVDELLAQLSAGTDKDFNVDLDEVLKGLGLGKEFEDEEFEEKIKKLTEEERRKYLYKLIDD